MYIHQKLALFLTASLAGYGAHAQQPGDAIIGRWNATVKTLTIEIYRSGSEYRGRIIDFKDHHNPVPASQRRDENNPDPGLRDRRLLGMDVLTGLHFDPDEKSWTDGNIYDVSSGKEYDATVELGRDGELHVRAYKGLPILGRTVDFVRGRPLPAQR